MTLRLPLVANTDTLQFEELQIGDDLTLEASSIVGISTLEAQNIVLTGTASGLVTSIVAGAGISVTESSGEYTITNTGAGTTYADVAGFASAISPTSTSLEIPGFTGYNQNLSENITLATGKNWLYAGPLHVSAGSSITIQGTATLRIL